MILEHDDKRITKKMVKWEKSKMGGGGGSKKKDEVLEQFPSGMLRTRDYQGWGRVSWACDLVFPVVKAGASIASDPLSHSTWAVATLEAFTCGTGAPDGHTQHCCLWAGRNSPEYVLSLGQLCWDRMQWQGWLLESCPCPFRPSRD